MTGIKNKKLPLNLSKEDFINKMIFHSDDETKKCKTYLELKGIEYHIVLANFVGLNNRGKIEYKKVSNLYQYDKRIRNILYKFMSAFEEGVRAFICNKYSSKMVSFKRISKCIFERVDSGSSLSHELENLELNKLLDLALKLPPEEQVELFGNTDKLAENLDAVRELRNAVSHHRLLFVYEEFEPCFLDGVEDETLQANVINLFNLLNPHYKDFYKKAINEAISDKDDKTFSSAISKKAVLII